MRGKISFHVGKKYSQKHNLREYDKDKWNTDKHIDDSCSHLNVVVKNENLEEFFDKVFGEALLDFNEKNYSKHPDRVIGYGTEKVDELVKKHGLEKAMELVREKAVHEYFLQQKKNVQEAIIQMSDSENFNALVEEKGLDKAIEEHTEFFNRVIADWTKNNPSLKIFSAVIHFNESTPHIHIDFLPVAETTRGLTVKVSTDGAMKNLGFNREKGQKYADTPFKQWLRAERSRVEEIAGKYMVVIPAEPSGSKGHQEYWQHRYDVEAERGLKKLIDSFKRKPTIEAAKSIIERSEEIIAKLTQEARDAKARHVNLEKDLQYNTEEFKRYIDETNAKFHQREAELDKRESTLIAERRAFNKEKVQFQATVAAKESYEAEENNTNPQTAKGVQNYEHSTNQSRVNNNFTR